MLLLAHIVSAFVLLLHVCIVLLETVLFNSRGRRVFGLSKENAVIVRPLMSNQGCYNAFLVVALVLGFALPTVAVAQAFMLYGLGCVLVAGLWGGATVGKRILLIQALPAAVALALYGIA